MKRLLLNLPEWRARLEGKPLAIFLDYDGTLSAIASTPQEAALPSQARQILEALGKLPNVKVAIVSGRALGVLLEMVKVPGLSYVGSHGAEFCSPGITSKRVSKKYYRMLQALKQTIFSGLGGMQGVLFEHKPISFAIHYRKATASVEMKVKRVVSDICSYPVLEGQVSLLRGKKVIEIMPPNHMNKCQAVELLWSQWDKKKYFPIFIGDDRTDEDAFEALRGCGLTIRVGASSASSEAEYYLDSVEDVRMLLKAILHFRRSK